MSAWLDLLPLCWSYDCYYVYFSINLDYYIYSSSSFLKNHFTLFWNHLKSRWSQANRVMWPLLLNHGGGIASNHGGRSAVDQIHSCVNDHQVSWSDESLGYHSSFPWHRWIMLRIDPWLLCLLRHNRFNAHFLIMFLIDISLFAGMSITLHRRSYLGKSAPNGHIYASGLDFEPDVASVHMYWNAALFAVRPSCVELISPIPWHAYW